MATTATMAAVLLLLAAADVCGGSLAQVKAALVVMRGRWAPLTDGQLQISVAPAEDCRVEVLTNEPITQRVGRLTPQVRPRPLQDPTAAGALVTPGLSAGV